MTSPLHATGRGLWLSATSTLIATALLSGLISGCGGSKSSGSSTSHTTSAAVPTATSRAVTAPGHATAAVVAQVRRDWTEFFAASTPNPRREALLQNGHRFAAVLAAQSQNPLAAQSQAKVTKVRVTGPHTARVTYEILLAGRPALTHQSGTATRSGQTWQVSDASFCSLLKLEGGAPAVCKG